jgi:hypothetical protein
MIVTVKLKRFDRDFYTKPPRHKRWHYLSPRRVTTKKMDKFFDLCLEWCYNQFGSHYAKDLPQIEWDWKDTWYQKNKLLALYDREENIITIRIQGHRTFNNLDKTTIHEYIHYLQTSGKRYEDAHDKLGYNKNPYEIEAEHLAQLYWGDCITKVMDQM